LVIASANQRLGSLAPNAAPLGATSRLTCLAPLASSAHRLRCSGIHTSALVFLLHDADHPVLAGRSRLSVAHDGRIGADRRSVFAAIVEDAFPPRFNGRKQSLRPNCCSDAASEADHEYGHVLARTRTGLLAARCSDTRGTAELRAVVCATS
jgi:hypothetical protein